MVNRATVEILGNLDAGFSQSVNKAQDSLAKLRREQRADIAEARRLDSVLKNLDKGTIQYNNTLNRLNEVKTNIGTREQELLDLTAAQQGADASGDRLTGTVGRLRGAIGRLGPVSIAATAGFGVLAGGLTFIHKSVTGLNEEVEQLETIQFSGFDQSQFQQLSFALADVTGDFKSARAQALSFHEGLAQAQEQLVFDPGAISGNYIRALSGLGLSTSDIIDLSPNEVLLRAIEGTRVLIDEQGIAFARANIAAVPFLASQRDIILEWAQGGQTLDEINGQIESQAVLSGRALERTKEYNQAVRDITEGFTNWKNELVTEFAPALTDALEIGLDFLGLRRELDELERRRGQPLTEQEILGGVLPTAEPSRGEQARSIFGNVLGRLDDVAFAAARAIPGIGGVVPQPRPVSAEDLGIERSDVDSVLDRFMRAQGIISEDELNQREDLRRIQALHGQYLSSRAADLDRRISLATDANIPTRDIQRFIDPIGLRMPAPSGDTVQDNSTVSQTVVHDNRTQSVTINIPDTTEETRSLVREELTNALGISQYGGR